MTLRYLIVGAAALGLSLGAAHAGNEAQGNPALSSDAKGFNDLDKNGDGALSRAEAAGNPWLAQRFGEVDEDKDGRLSRTEYLKTMAVKDFNTLREKTADLIEPGDQSAGGGTAKKK